VGHGVRLTGPSFRSSFERKGDGGLFGNGDELQGYDAEVRVRKRGQVSPTFAVTAVTAINEAAKPERRFRSSLSIECYLDWLQDLLIAAASLRL